MDKISVGQILEFLPDDPAVQEDIESSVKRLEQILLEAGKEG